MTYKNQPLLDDLKGKVPLEGTANPYTVTELLWTPEVHTWLQRRLIGRTLHVCCGKSELGDVRVDIDPEHSPDILCDAADMSEFVEDEEFDTVLCDPPYTGEFQWTHDLLSELARVSKQRIIFQHWFMPIDRKGRFKKDHRFHVVEVAVFQPDTYFGRVQVITIMDKAQERLL